MRFGCGDGAPVNDMVGHLLRLEQQQMSNDAARPGGRILAPPVC
jgi:hypothetical protein